MGGISNGRRSGLISPPATCVAKHLSKSFRTTSTTRHGPHLERPARARAGKGGHSHIMTRLPERREHRRWLADARSRRLRAGPLPSGAEMIGEIFRRSC